MIGFNNLNRGFRGDPTGAVPYFSSLICIDLETDPIDLVDIPPDHLVCG